MAGLLVAIAVMGIGLSVAMPTWRTWATREKEAELIFRGEQYMRAIELYQRRFAGVFPADLDMLVEQRFLRRAFTDPMAGDPFEILTQASVRLASGQGLPAPAAPGDSQQEPSGRVSRVDNADDRETSSSRTPFTAAARGMTDDGAGGGGGIIGVVSRSTETSFKLYNNRNRYDEWLFVYLPQAAQPGVATGDPINPAQPGVGGAIGGFGDITRQPGGGAQGRGAGQPRTRGSRPGVSAPRGDGPGVGGSRPGGPGVSSPGSRR